MLLPSVEVIGDGKSILFLGAGFSSFAKNTLGEEIKDVSGLVRQLLLKSNVSNPDGYDLDTAAEKYLEENGSIGESELPKLLHGNFSCRYYTDQQKIIACQPWYRIYTTNYDNVVETIFATEGKAFTEKTVSESVEPPIQATTQLVHIYGSVRNVSPDEFRRSFLLTESQRDRSPFLTSRWYMRFYDDVLSCSSVVFVGFSLTDIDIRRLLDRVPEEAHQKIHFVTWDGEKPPIITRLKRFGTVHTLGVRGFADYLGRARLAAAPSSSREPPMNLRRLSYSLKSRAKISSRDIENLMITGEADLDLFSQLDADGAPGSYTLPRSPMALSRISQAASAGRSVLIHGDVGNGKSIFSRTAGYIFSLNGYDAFVLARQPESKGEILSFLQNVTKRTVVIFDNIMAFGNLPESVSNIGKKEIVIIGTVRSNMIDIDRASVIKKFGQENLVEVDLNNANPREVSLWTTYLDENGLFGKNASKSKQEKEQFLARRCGGQLRDVILELYKSGSLHSRVEELLASIASLDKQSTRIIGLSSILTMSNFQQFCSFATVTELAGSTISIEDFRAKVSEKSLLGLLRLERGDIVVRSPALAQFILERIFGLPEILQISRTAIRYISSYLSDESDFLLLAKTLLKYSTYQALVSNPDDAETLENFYDDCRIYEFAQGDPLFWVQRSICSLKRNDLVTATRFVDNAYSVARKLPRFDTYQIDNHNARILLSRSIHEGVSEGVTLERKASSLLQSVLARKSDDLHHPLKVMGMFPVIVDTWRSKLTKNQSKELIEIVDDCLKSVANAKHISSRFRDLPKLEKDLRAARIFLLNR